MHVASHEGRGMRGSTCSQDAWSSPKIDCASAVHASCSYTLVSHCGDPEHLLAVLDNVGQHYIQLVASQKHFICDMSEDGHSSKIAQFVPITAWAFRVFSLGAGELARIKMESGMATLSTEILAGLDFWPEARSLTPNC
jgi:hypothetical protein